MQYFYAVLIVCIGSLTGISLVLYAKLQNLKNECYEKLNNVDLINKEGNIMYETIEDMIKFFEERAVPIQITLDYGKMPTVHAMYQGDIHKTSGQNVFYCLEKMREKLFK